MASPPLFVTFEGIEGSGKSVQVRLLAEELRRRGVAHVISREPGGTEFGGKVRDILLRHDGVEREPLAELLLYLADRYQHLKEVVEPKLSAGFHVISDRYHDATMAYQGHARGIGFETIDQLARILELRKPDLTIVLDVPVEVGLPRARTREREDRNSQLGRFEFEDLQFHEKVREGYRLLQQRDPGRIVFVDGNDSPNRVFSRVLEVLHARKLLDQARWQG